MIEANGARLHIRDIGFGKPVILLHGYGQNSRVFWGLERHLVLSRRVILIDSRGHGLSEKGEIPISISLMASDVAAVMDALNIDRAAIIGYSDGGNIALQMAVDFPARVSSIVAISGNARPEGVRRPYMWLIRMWKRLWKLFHINTDMMNLLLEQPQLTNGELRGITAPALLIYGSHDMVTKAHIRELHEAIPGSKLKFIKHTGHSAIVGKWPGYAEDVGQFI